MSKPAAYYDQLLANLDKRFFGSVANIPDSPRRANPGIAALNRFNARRRNSNKECLSGKEHDYQPMKWRTRSGKPVERCAACLHRRTCYAVA